MSLVAKAQALYPRFPRPLQRAGVAAYGYWWRHQRVGGRFREYRDGFASRERYGEEQWREWQEENLRSLLERAWEAPFYREAWGRLGLSPAETRRFGVEDLRRLPVLSKDDLRADPKAVCPAGRVARGTGTYYTSGSTGTPLTHYRSADDQRRGVAIRDARYQGSAGVDYSIPRATFSGRQVETDPDSSGPFHRYNPAEKQVYLSPYHLSRETAGAYVKALEEHRPRWITGYASAIHDLAAFALERGIECPRLEAAIPAAEPLPPRIREVVGEAFGCRVFEEYGLIEGVAFALECEQGSLHVSPDAGIVEILDEELAPCGPGEVGEIVATGFLYMSQVMVRYRTGDLGSWSDRGCGCGRSMPVLAAVEGRVDDVVVGPDGRRVGRLSTVPKNLPGVLFTQFVQERRDAIAAHVVCEGDLREDVREELQRRLTGRLGTGMRVEVRQVEDLERTSRGKIRGIVSRLPDSERGEGGDRA